MRIGALVSGSGTNLQALLSAQATGDLNPARIELVLCNRPGARALERARAAGVATRLVDHTEFATREAFEEALLGELRAAEIEAVVLAGFMRVLTGHFLSAFPDRIINTHPALCPSFPGLHAAAQALDYGARVTGCTVHFVDAGVDTGPIIYQAAVPILRGDSPESLQARIQKEEHQLLPRAVQRLAAGKLRVEGRLVVEEAT